MEGLKLLGGHFLRADVARIIGVIGCDRAVLPDADRIRLANDTVEGCAKRPIEPGGGAPAHTGGAPEAGEAEIEAVKAKLKTTGVHVLVLPGELTTAIGAIGDPEGVRELGLEGMAGVDRVVPISRPYKLASSELAHHEPTEFAVDGRRVGGNETFFLIAGIVFAAFGAIFLILSLVTKGATD